MSSTRNESAERPGALPTSSSTLLPTSVAKFENIDNPLSTYFNSSVIQLPVIIAWLLTPTNEVSDEVRLNQRPAKQDVVLEISKSTKPVDAPFSVVLCKTADATTIGCSKPDDKNDNAQYTIAKTIDHFATKVKQLLYDEKIQFDYTNCVELLSKVWNDDDVDCVRRSTITPLKLIKEDVHQTFPYRFHTLDGNHRFQSINLLASTQSCDLLHDRFWQPASVTVFTPKDDNFGLFSEHNMRYLRYKSMCINAKYVRVSGTGAITLLQIALDMVNT
jgi:hypothetical protein